MKWQVGVASYFRRVFVFSCSTFYMSRTVKEFLALTFQVFSFFSCSLLSVIIQYICLW